MSLPEEDYYSKHRYQINIIECAYAVVQKLKSEQIPNHVIAEYAHIGSIAQCNNNFHIVAQDIR
jgi:hypothetical protein